MQIAIFIDLFWSINATLNPINALGFQKVTFCRSLVVESINCADGMINPCKLDDDKSSFPIHL